MDPMTPASVSPTSYVLAKTDFSTELENAAATTVNGNKLKHAHTEGQFSKLTNRQGSAGSTGQETSAEHGGQDSDGAKRFDSHNMLRSDEASDLLDLPEESAEQIWLKHGLVRRDESAIAIADLENHQDIPSAINGLFQRPQTVPEGLEEGEADENPDRKAAGDGRLTLSTASISATILKDDDEEMQSQSRSSVKLRRTSSTEDGRDRRDNQRQSLYSEGEAGLSLTGTNDSSYGQGDSASAKKKKTLTRRLSSFFSKSFRRKSKDSSRPVSTFGTPQAELSEEDFVSERRQQLVDVGFSLSLDEVLLDEPDSFIFVPLSDSGYFSTDLSQVEKMSMRASSSHSAFEGTAHPLATTSTSSPRPRSAAEPRLRSRNETLTVQHPPQVIQPSSNTAKETPKKPRRLSFVEGTSIIENINHLVYAPASDTNGPRSPHSADSSPAYGYGDDDDDDGEAYGERRAPTTSQSYDQLSSTFQPHSAARRAKKLRFKNHPWKWIKSKF